MAFFSKASHVAHRYNPLSGDEARQANASFCEDIVTNLVEWTFVPNGDTYYRTTRYWYWFGRGQDRDGKTYVARYDDDAGTYLECEATHQTYRTLGLSGARSWLYPAHASKHVNAYSRSRRIADWFKARLQVESCWNFALALMFGGMVVWAQKDPDLWPLVAFLAAYFFLENAKR